MSLDLLPNQAVSTGRVEHLKYVQDVFITAKGILSHFQSRPTSRPYQPPAATIAPPSPSVSGCTFLDTSHQWNPTTHGLSGLASFTEHNVLRTPLCHGLCQSLSKAEYYSVVRISLVSSAHPSMDTALFPPFGDCERRCCEHSFTGCFVWVRFHWPRVYQGVYFSCKEVPVSRGNAKEAKGPGAKDPKCVF